MRLRSLSIVEDASLALERLAWTINTFVVVNVLLVIW